MKDLRVKKKITYKKEESLNEQILLKDNIKLGLSNMTRDEAIKLAGQILVDSEYVEEEYIEAMLQREKDLSTYIGNGAAIPHGVSEAKKKIKKTGICILQFPEGISYGNETVYLLIGIAGVGNEHLLILSNLAEILDDESKVKELRTTRDINFVYRQFTNQ